MTEALRNTFKSAPRLPYVRIIAAVLTAVLLSFLSAPGSFAQEPIPDGPAPAPWGPAGDKRKNTTTLER